MGDSSLSPTEVKILRELSINPNCTTKSFPAEYLPVIKRLARRRLLACNVKMLGAVWIWSVQITQMGRDALSEFESAREKMAQDVANDQAEQQRVAMERAADIRRDYVLFVLGLVFGWLLGLVTPLDVWSWIQSLFH